MDGRSEKLILYKLKRLTAFLLLRNVAVLVRKLSMGDSILSSAPAGEKIVYGDSNGEAGDGWENVNLSEPCGVRNLRMPWICFCKEFTLLARVLQLEQPGLDNRADVPKKSGPRARPSSLLSFCPCSKAFRLWKS